MLMPYSNRVVQQHVWDARQAAVQKQDLSCTYLAHHELEGASIIVIGNIIIVIVIILLLLVISQQHVFSSGGVAGDDEDVAVRQQEAQGEAHVHLLRPGPP